MTMNNFQDNESPHELLLTTRQTTKIRNTIAKNMSTDVKLSKAQFFKTELTRLIYLQYVR